MQNKLQQKIVVTGAAGLVGQNLCLRLTEAGYTNIVGIDKNENNLAILAEHQPTLKLLLADLSEPGEWQDTLADADTIVLNQAQIGGLNYEDFHRNNVRATQNILAATNPENPPYIVHISSSVVNSQADDFYVQSKTEQEDLVRAQAEAFSVLRPTLMFGWFDRKHLGWLHRFMQKSPIFPIPGNGKYVRQPLYVGDFCRVIMACIQTQPNNEVFDISGHEKIHYIEIIRAIKKSSESNSIILKIPYWSFWLALKIVGIFHPNPPFTTTQLAALVIPEEFPITNWPERFDLEPTKFEAAVRETFENEQYSEIVLEF